MKRILVINLGKANGGAEKYILDIYKYATKEKFEFHFLTRKGTPLNKKLLSFEKSNDTCVFKSFDYILKDIPQLREYVRKEGIDLIHSNGILSNLLAVLISLGYRKTKRLTTIHGDAKFDRADKSVFYREAFAILEVILSIFNNKYVAVSNSIKEILISRHIRKDKIVTIYNGVELYEVFDKEKKNDTFKICSIGRLELVKDHLTLLKALEYFIDKHPDVHLICDIYGEGSCKHELLMYINSHKLENVVCLKGYVNDAYTHIHNYHLFVQSSLYETFGLSIVESMVERVPIISTNVGGVKEIIKNKDNGLLFNKGDSNTLACLIYELYTNSELYTSLSDNGYNSAVKNFDIRKNILELENLYSKLYKGKE
ncbi:glycosyltransferase family 4 protein [Amedibacillus sp. YH-ame10]